MNGFMLAELRQSLSSEPKILENRHYAIPLHRLRSHLLSCRRRHRLNAHQRRQTSKANTRSSG